MQAIKPSAEYTPTFRSEYLVHKIYYSIYLRRPSRKPSGGKVITTLTLVIIGVLSLLSAIVCDKCSETYDGRAKHTCTVTNEEQTGDKVAEWFDAVQTTLSGLIALDWAKNGTVIERVTEVLRIAAGEAALVYEIPEWFKEKYEDDWSNQIVLILGQGEHGFSDEKNPVLVHQATLIRETAGFLKTMNTAGHLIHNGEGLVTLMIDAKLEFALVKIGGRSRYELTFTL